MANTELVIKTDNLPQLINGGDRILVAPDGEQLIIRLLELQTVVENAVQMVKDKLAAGMEAIDPDLSSVNSDMVKILYRVYGSKYNLDENVAPMIDPKFYTMKTSYTPNASEIDKYFSETGSLPNGVTLNDRKKSLSIKVKEDGK